MWKPDICIYHFPCDDGFGAAWAVWLKWGDTVDFRPTNYGQPVPDHDIDGKNILIADFSFKPDVLETMDGRANSIIILDHHKTAEADLTHIYSFAGSYEHASGVIASCIRNTGRNVIAWFDMERSGASLAWAFCHPGETQPSLIRHIEDRDLWRMNYPKTRPLSLYLRSLEYDFGVWSQVMDRFDGDRDAVLAEASAIERFYDRKLVEMVPTATLQKIGNWQDVPVANAPWAFASDLGHELLKAHPQAPFAAVWFENYGARTFSLRSEDSRQDVSEVARQFGGGGHRNAAGFRCPA